ncbi:hypothetical protein CACET_c27570 [Clostridium aceticum]|uniref:Uncharacterized protein n=2 Tax=Clostridium aceticum TaxID=84022 RepID=A0A0G3WE55_9CLOT|nr:hypothetical protein [Clostridium aceticum]AKL96202.1 hypothetical protein CACET_c27570 [Clostridium aceticum]
MLFSTERKQILCNWLLENNRDTFMSSPLKVQKFIFMYECMSKVGGYEYELNEELAKRINFIISSLTENELSDITHLFNIWKSKEQEIVDGKKHVDLHEYDFNECDEELIKDILSIYPMKLVDYYKIIDKNPKYFLIHVNDYDKLSEELHGVIDVLATKDDLINPVYLTISETGGLLVD